MLNLPCISFAYALLFVYACSKVLNYDGNDDRMDYDILEDIDVENV